MDFSSRNKNEWSKILLSIATFLAIIVIAMSLSIFLFERLKTMPLSKNEVHWKSVFWIIPLPIIGLFLFHILRIDILSIIMLSVYALTLTLFIRALLPLNKSDIVYVPCFIISASLVALSYVFRLFLYNNFLTLILSSTVATILAISIGFKTSILMLAILSIYDFIAVYSGFMPAVIPKTLELTLAPIFVIQVDGEIGLLGAGDVVFSCFILIEFWKTKGKHYALIAFLTLITAIGLTLFGVWYGLKIAPVLPSIFLASLVAWLLEKILKQKGQIKK